MKAKTFKKYVRVPRIPGTVVEIFSGAELFPMTEVLRLTWYKADAEVEEGWVFDGKEFSAPKSVVNLPEAPPVDIVQEGIKSIGEKADTIQKEIKKSIDVIAQTKVNNDELKVSLKDIYEGLAACKGFLIMIPKLQADIDQLTDMISKLNQQTKGKK